MASQRCWFFALALLLGCDSRPVQRGGLAVDAPDAAATVAEDGRAEIAPAVTVTPAVGVAQLRVQGAPLHGELAATAEGFAYTPARDFNGEDLFTYYAEVNGLKSRTATVTVTVTPVNDAPVAAGAEVAASEDTPVEGALAASDVDGDALTFELAAPAAHGTAEVREDGRFRYSPAPDYIGEDAFSFLAYDGDARSEPARVVVVVSAVTDPPVAEDVEVATDEDVPVSGTLTASDPDADPLSFKIESPPLYGTAAVTNEALGRFLYTPSRDYNGMDSFVFAASDGAAEARATVAVTVRAVNDAPVTSSVTLRAVEDTPFEDALPASDVDGDALTFAIAAQPSHGSAEVMEGGRFRYTPAADFNGPDRFTFTASDGRAPTVAQEVAFTVAPVNDLPVAHDFAPATAEDAELRGALSVSDADGDLLIYSIVARPQHGALTLLDAQAGTFLYAPAADYNGADAFTFRARDGQGFSNTATASVTVTPVNDAPVARDVRVATLEDRPVTGQLRGEDVDGDALTFRIVTQPLHGNVAAGASGAFTYTPARDFQGTDTFTFVARDAALESSPATVSVEVQQSNDAPRASDLLGTTAEDTPLSGALPASDPDGDPLEFRILTQPSHGTVSLEDPEAGAFTYRPAQDYNGADEFRFDATDGLLDSGAATVRLTVTPVNDAPVAQDGVLATNEGTPVSGTLVATDVDGDTLSFAVTAPPANGGVALTGAAFTYTPAAGFAGTDTFTFTASDGALSASAVVTITVAAVPQITSLFPARGTAGGTLVIQGRRFGTSTGAVTVGGIAATVFVWGDDYVSVEIPASLDEGAYPVVVRAPLGDTAPAAFTVIPWLHSVKPNVIRTGDDLALAGAALGSSAGTVNVGGVAATVRNWSSIAADVTSAPATPSGKQPVVARTSRGTPTNALSVAVRGSDMWIQQPELAGRAGHTAVWTGTEMIIWGGAASGALTATGLRYNPAADSWAPTSLAGAPAARRDHVAVWTGSEMVVWGGPGNTGGRYDPVTDTWRPTSISGAPIARSSATAVWTGKEMVVWGGFFTNTGGRYDPLADRWTVTTLVNAPVPRYLHSAVWTGREMIVWGGSGSTGAYQQTGGRYDPSLDRWTATTTTGAPLGRNSHTGVWTGRDMIVWGGLTPAGLAYTGGKYDPTADRWAATTVNGAPPARMQHVSVWTGREMAVWGGTTTGAPGGLYDPAGDRWTFMTIVGAPAPRLTPTAVWTGREMIVWGGSVSGAATNTGGRYDVPSNSWRPTAVRDPGARRYQHVAAWTGTEMIAWGGLVGGAASRTGVRYSPATDTFTATSLTGAPPARSGWAGAWTGSELFVWGPPQGGLNSPGIGGLYNPATNAWRSSTNAGAPVGRSGHTIVWTGREGVAWGGSNGNTMYNTGGRYDPALDRWTATATTPGPSARYAHAAVWTGTDMVVWGGRNCAGSCFELGDGGRYNPTADQWTQVSTFGAPSLRYAHTAVWTGSRVIFWGGLRGGTALNDGGEWDPLSDAWTATQATGAPGGRYYHTALWTGTEMIIWGGWSGARANTGGRYNPATRTWRPTTLIDAAPAAYQHTAVWTGDEMIVYGGDTLSNVAGFGRYLP